MLNGSTTPIGEQVQSNLTPIDIDGSAFFETALLETGEMVISFTNELPVTLKTLDFDLINKLNGSVIASAIFTNVLPNVTAIQILDLSGKRVNAALQVKIKLLETEASNGPVLIDAQKGLNINIAIRNLKAKEATAAFPSQTIIEQDEPLTQFFEGAELKYVKVRSGKLKISLFTSIQENMTLYLTIPSAQKGGVMINEVIKVAGASNGKPTIINKEIDMTGYVIDYRGKNPDVTDTVNTFYQVMRVTLDSSGRKVSVSLQDSINISYQLVQIIPDYAIGFLGSSVNQTGNEEVDFDLFRQLRGNIELDDITMRIKMYNGIGAIGNVLTNYLTSYNSFANKSVPLTASIINDNYAIGSAIFNPFTSRDQEIELNTTNSNVKDFVENLPDKIKFNMEVGISPQGNTNFWRDFVYYDSRFKIDLQMIFPARLDLQNLQFKDSVPLDIVSIENNDRIKSSTLNLFYENSFPFNLGFFMVTYDAYGNRLDTLINNAGSGIMAGVNGNATKGQAVVTVPANKIGAFRNAKYAELFLNANSNGNKVQLSNTDACKIDISADVQFQQKIKN